MKIGLRSCIRMGGAVLAGRIGIEPKNVAMELLEADGYH
jgi:hypothetical protein